MSPKLRRIFTRKYWTSSKQNVGEGSVAWLIFPEPMYSASDAVVKTNAETVTTFMLLTLANTVKPNMYSVAATALMNATSTSVVLASYVRRQPGQ